MKLTNAQTWDAMHDKLVELLIAGDHDGAAAIDRLICDYQQQHGDTEEEENTFGEVIVHVVWNDGSRS